MDEIQVLIRAGHLVRQGWTKGSYARIDADEPMTRVTPLDPAARCFCARGAIRRALAEQAGETLAADEYGSAEIQAAEARLADYVAHWSINKDVGQACDLASANDRPDTTADMVCGWFEKAINAAKHELRNGRFTHYLLAPVLLGDYTVRCESTRDAEERAAGRPIAWALYGEHAWGSVHVGDYQTEADVLSIYAMVTGKLAAPSGLARVLPA